MKKAFAGVAVMAVCAVTSGIGRADDRPKGPSEDGTLPALTRIAGEGFANSHAFEYLTELTDDIGMSPDISSAVKKFLKRKLGDPFEFLTLETALPSLLTSR